MYRKLTFLLVALSSLLLPAYGFAGVVAYGNRSVFDAQGTIAYNSNFQDFGTVFGFPGDPFTRGDFTRGDVTYNSHQNLTWGSSTRYTTTEPLIGNNHWTPVLGAIATGPKYDMFGFDIGTYNLSPITITISSNVANYTYPSLTIANSRAGLLEFRGFVASSGEYFTGFSIVPDNGPGNLPGITNVALGHATVPEPCTLAIWSLLGVCGMGIGWRRRKQTA